MKDKRYDSADHLVVLTDELASVVEEWLTQWEADRPRAPFAGTLQTPHGKTMVSFYNGIPWLSDESGVPYRSIRRILGREGKYTTLGIADKLLTAIGWTHDLDTLVRVVPNPRYSQEQWQTWYNERTCDD
jgi:hypothetical protein